VHSRLQSRMTKSAEPNAAQHSQTRQPGVPAPAAHGAHSCACGGTCPRCVAQSHHLEREADAVADRIVSEELGEPTPGASRITEVASAGGDPVPPDDAIARAAQDRGAPLPTALRSYYEPRFGRDFGDVQIHSDGNAADAARSIDARAYTAGQDIVFGTGAYAPDTVDGRRLLAHELTHVAQQSHSPHAMRGAPVLQRQKVNDKMSKSDYDQRVLEGHVQPYPGLTLSWTENGFVIWSDLELRGTEATQAKADEIKATITSVWMQKFPKPSGYGEYVVIPVISVTLAKPGAAPATDKGGIELFRDPTRVSHIEKIGSGTPRDRKMTINLNSGLSWTPAHEFGHYIGLDDHYTVSTPATGGRKTTPDAGWEGDLMAEDGGKLSMRDVNELLHWWANWSA
jgi:hypothetical protein